jgi:predicted membrane channel-forming protein YqfA (hemolysin III family)
MITPMRLPNGRNAASHLLGVAGSLIFALVVLIGKDRYDTTATFAGMLVYASTLLLLYASPPSTTT